MVEVFIRQRKAKGKVNQRKRSLIHHQNHHKKNIIALLFLWFTFPFAFLCLFNRWLKYFFLRLIIFQPLLSLFILFSNNFFFRSISVDRKLFGFSTSVSYF